MSAKGPRRQPYAGPRRARRLPLLATAALLVVAAACSPASGPIERGNLQVVLQDHPEAAGPAGVAGPHPGVLLAHHKRFGSDYFHGRLAARFRLLLSTDGVVWMEAIDATALAVDLQAPDRNVKIEARVPAGTYRHLRIVLEDAEATLDPGSSIGGLDLRAVERLSIEEGRHVQAQLPLPAPLDVSSTGAALLVIDWNAESWVTEDHVVAGSVPAVEVIRMLGLEVGTAPARAFLRSL